MISTFEASILGFISNGPCSRYNVMKSFQKASIFWSGSPGSIYIAIDRLEKRGFLKDIAKDKTKIYEVTGAGLEALEEFLQVPVPAEKLFVDPAALKIKLRGFNHLEPGKRITFCHRQLDEFRKAKELIEQRIEEHQGRWEVTQDLADLTLQQLSLEESFIKGLLAKEKN